MLHRNLTVFLSVLTALLYSESASGICAPPECCMDMYVGSNEEVGVSLVRITAYSQGTIEIELLDKQIYCDGGEVCTDLQFPEELKCDDGESNKGCYPCSGIEVGQEGVLLFASENGCVVFFAPVENEKAICDGKKVPVDFVLEHALTEQMECIDAHLSEGYARKCSDQDSCAGCSHGSEAEDVVFLVVLILLLFRMRLQFM